MRPRIRVLAALLTVLSPAVCHGQARTEENVVYGMYSGLALLMDVHYPSEPNGYGIIVIPGSGWHMPLHLDAAPLKNGVSRPVYRSDSLLEAGYTLFAINHRAAPRFRYPAAVEDAQRAVRFIRHNASTYGINPTAIGALGDSSGGYLVNMLGVLDGRGIPEDPSPINRESAKVQAVVALFAPSDFVSFARGLEGARGYVSSFLGAPYPLFLEMDPHAAQLYSDASPMSHVSPDDPPFLLIHGDLDPVVPFQQSGVFRDALASHEVEVQLIRVTGGGHGGSLLEGSNAATIFTPMVAWFDDHLRADQ